MASWEEPKSSSDSAHGTNPASAAMAGFEIIEIPSQEDGRIDLDALRAVVGDDTAAMMILTQVH